MDSYYMSLRAGISEDLWEMTYGELTERGGGGGRGELSLSFWSNENNFAPVEIPVIADQPWF